MKKIIVLLLIFPLLINAQERKNRPTPEFSDFPYAILNDSVKGWSYSLDGQWLSGEKLIPSVGISENTTFYEQKENQLGVDNFIEYRSYEVTYGRDKLVCFVKIYNQGAFKYPTRKKGWRENLNIFYMLVGADDLKKLKNLEPGKVHVERLRAFAGGNISNAKEKEVLEQIKARLLVRPSFDKNLVFTLNYLEKEKKVRFQVFSLHEIFPDLDGVRTDFSKKGNTLYGSVHLFDFLYYEVNYYDFAALLENTGEENEFSEDGDSENIDDVDEDDYYDDENE